MSSNGSQSHSNVKTASTIRHLYAFLAPRAHSVIVFAALFCTLAVKLFISFRADMFSQYFGWILEDIAVLLGIEAVLATACFRWRRRWVIRVALIVAAVVCTWSVMNAGWLIRTGSQILPPVVLPLIRDPRSSLVMVRVNLVAMPTAAFALLVPSAVALTFFLFVLARPQILDYDRKHFKNKTLISCVIIFITVLGRGVMANPALPQCEEFRYNCHLRAITSFIWPNSNRLTKSDFESPSRKIPTFDQLKLPLLRKSQAQNQNVVVIILEGIQYKYTSLADPASNLTPYLAGLAQQGVEFSNMRSSLTHTTKALFSLLTGRFPSISQDIAEAVPVIKPYASLATILKSQKKFRTAFFQSAKGDFESRPGLIHNLGFDKFWARENSNDPNAFIGSLGCDEFVMLEPIIQWVKADDRPFLLTILFSITHDPYEVPKWFAEPAKQPVQRYKQAIFYTDKFIAALEVELARLNLLDKTIISVIGDHGEAFGEHDLFGHDRIAFDEALRIPWVIRAPSLIEPATKVTEPVSSVDFVPTLLTLLGFDIKGGDFDGLDTLGSIPSNRKVYFSCWISQGPAGFLKSATKFIYNPVNKTVFSYDLQIDPSELSRSELHAEQSRQITNELITWQKNSIFQLDQTQTGEKLLFGSWLCKWEKRQPDTRHQVAQRQ